MESCIKYNFPAKLSLEIAKQIAKVWEGDCLSKEYVNCIVSIDFYEKKHT